MRTVNRLVSYEAKLTLTYFTTMSKTGETCFCTYSRERLQDLWSSGFLSMFFVFYFFYPCSAITILGYLSYLYDLALAVFVMLW